MMSSFKLATSLHSLDFRSWLHQGSSRLQLCVHLGIFVLNIGLKQSVIN